MLACSTHAKGEKMEIFITKDTIEKLARLFAMSVLTQKVGFAYVRWNDLESDGRKLKTLKRRLLKEKLVVDDKNDDNDYQVATAQVFESITPQKMRRDAYTAERDTLPGVRLGDLPVEELAHVALHQEEYVFTVKNSWNNDETVVTPQEWANNKAYTSQHSLYVATIEWMANRTEVKEEVRSRKLLATNLAWGLIKLKLLIEKDATEFIKIKMADALPFPGDSTPRFGPNPEQWHVDLAEAIEETQKRIKLEQNRLDVFEYLQGRIHELGGWGNFRKQYTEALSKELAKEQK